jgi:hypothetical protein
MDKSHCKWPLCNMAKLNSGQRRKYLPEWSTQPKVTAPNPDPDMVQEDKCRYLYAATMETGQIYTDITGRFPTPSHSGNKYILVLYDYDSKSVLTAPMKNRGYREMFCAFDLLIQSLIMRGLCPLL